MMGGRGRAPSPILLSHLTSSLSLPPAPARSDAPRLHRPSLRAGPPPPSQSCTGAPPSRAFFSADALTPRTAANHPARADALPARRPAPTRLRGQLLPLGVILCPPHRSLTGSMHPAAGTFNPRQIQHPPPPPPDSIQRQPPARWCAGAWVVSAWSTRPWRR
ncbi:hypothetical protein ACQJBY_028643 [Aegilops geniculata]